MQIAVRIAVQLARQLKCVSTVRALAIKVALPLINAGPGSQGREETPWSAANPARARQWTGGELRTWKNPQGNRDSAAAGRCASGGMTRCTQSRHIRIRPWCDTLRRWQSKDQAVRRHRNPTHRRSLGSRRAQGSGGRRRSGRPSPRTPPAPRRPLAAQRARTGQQTTGRGFAVLPSSRPSS